MDACLRVFWTCDRDKTLLCLRDANVPQKVKDGITALTLIW
ncbi:hypothetical protein [Scytonema sp. UIC 10036]|nr:hypothetical protein [Scytonema sp. UIC 10036]